MHGPDHEKCRQRNRAERKAKGVKTGYPVRSLSQLGTLETSQERRWKPGVLTANQNASTQVCPDGLKCVRKTPARHTVTTGSTKKVSRSANRP